MSKKSAPQTTGGHKVTVSNYILQLGQRCNYTDFIPLPLMRNAVRLWANPGTHDVSNWMLGQKVTLEVRPAVGPYQCAVLRHKGDGVAVMHAGLDATGGVQAWNAAHALNASFVTGLCASVDGRALAPFLQTHPELTVPTGPAMITSVIPGTAEVPATMLVLEDLTRQLFWALHLRHTAGANGSA
ncbi:MAG: hypothetical protein HYV96_11115 [Opitutae bacterium]|nr:hypothetical protein [Opitutae bacterium]